MHTVDLVFMHDLFHNLMVQICFIIFNDLSTSAVGGEISAANSSALFISGR